MKYASITFLLSFAWQWAVVQSDTTTFAPDFTITTTDGTTSQLYADYLDKGKTVVLLIFNTMSPKSMNISPLLEPFYQEWGGGDGPIELIGLSNLENDTNEKIARYKSIVGHTYPAAGDNGGSLLASKPYVDGTFGVFSTPPVFVIVTPDKMVRYDLKGNSDQATIDAVDQALRQLGIEKPAVGFLHSGIVTLGDSITPVNEVGIKVRGTDTDFAMTDSTGAFAFTTPLIAGNNYTLQFSKKGSVTNGVTTFDLVKLQRHVLGTELLTSPYQLIAADVDRSGSISIIDIVLLRKLVLNLETTLPNNVSWIFINGDYEFLDPASPFTEVSIGEATYFKFTANQRKLPPFNVIAIKLGDINFSAQ